MDDTAHFRVVSADERRDVQRAIKLWKQNTWGDDCIPMLDTFDFSAMRGDWGYRFLLCGGTAVENAVFVAYGPRFAELLRLPGKATSSLPFMQQIPERYRNTFAQGYDSAGIESSPVTLNGMLKHDGKVELYRAVFMPIMLQPNWSKQLIFGSFNFRAVEQVS